MYWSHASICFVNLPVLQATKCSFTSASLLQLPISWLDLTLYIVHSLDQLGIKSQSIEANTEVITELLG
jgi:hypothetical protein